MYGQYDHIRLAWHYSSYLIYRAVYKRFTPWSLVMFYSSIVTHIFEPFCFLRTSNYRPITVYTLLANYITINVSCQPTARPWERRTICCSKNIFKKIKLIWTLENHTVVCEHTSVSTHCFSTHGMDIIFTMRSSNENI